MGKNSELKIPCLKTHNFEYEEYKTFIEIVGEQNASKEIRAMIKKFNDLQKGQQTTLDQLTDKNTLDHFANLNNNISMEIHKLEDIEMLDRIEKNGHLIKCLAKTRKKNIHSQLLKELQKRR